MKRYLTPFLLEDLKEKMVFVGGPRQVGKTTLALNLLSGNATESHPAYLTWDSISTRNQLTRGALPADESLIIFDEIHKYKGWRNMVKGFYDTQKSQRQFLITGSARLDYYRRGGDSLQGRFHYHRLHPLSLFEVSASPSSSDLDQLFHLGGFPEPFLKANKRSWKRWQRDRRSRVIQEDLIHLEKVKEVSQMDLLASTLPDRVGSSLSISNLRQDLSVAYETVDRWIAILENLYYCYRIAPFGLPKLRAVKKEQKVYMWDWSLCQDEGARFENMVASNLLKYCHHKEDTEGDDMELRYIRDSIGREIDFVVVRNGKPSFAVECKTRNASLSKNIEYFAQRTSIPTFYQVHMSTRDEEISNYRARILPMTSLATVLKI